MNRLALQRISLARHSCIPTRCGQPLLVRYNSSTPPPTSPPQPPAPHISPNATLNEVDKSFVDALDDVNTIYPDLMTADPLMDLHQSEHVPPTRRLPYAGKIVIRNDPSMFTAYQEVLEKTAGFSEQQARDAEEDEDVNPLAFTHLSQSDIRRLHVYPLIRQRITLQTGKGKVHRMKTLVVVGNGNGLVGYGEGKDFEAARANDKALAEAIRNMDYVDRFEKRTIWTEMDTKFGSVRILLRPRPVGFGLHCNPNIHQVLKAAGIKDISAKVWGSRNPGNVIKALFRMLHAGNAPLAMGDGIGGGGRRTDKGAGMRGKEDVERERGRKMVSLRMR